MPRWACGIVLLVAMGGCEVEPTQLVVVIATDMDIPGALTGYRLQVTSQDGRERLQADGLSVPLSADADLPDSFGIRPIGGDPARRVQVDVTAVGPDGLDAFTTTARTYFLEGRRLRLDMFLSRRCVALECEGGRTCRQGECLEPEIDPHELPVWDSRTPLQPPFDAGPAPDAATDAATDAAVDPAEDAGGGLDAGLDAGVDAAVGCDPISNNCRDDSQVCRVVDDGSTACLEPSALREPCMFDEECPAGQDCVREATASGFCRPYCQRDEDCGSPGRCLALPVVGGGGPVGYCSMDCDVSAGCGDDFACVPAEMASFGGGTVRARMCWSEGSAVDFEGCDDVERCAIGYVCHRPIPGQREGLCRPVCDLDTPCVDGTVCVALVEAGWPLPVGVCSASCNPDLGEACEAALPELTCTLENVLDVEEQSVGAALCLPRTGNGFPGDACTFSSDCHAGLSCSVGACQEVCDVADSEACTPVGACVSYVPEFVVLGVEYGLCE